MRNIKMYESKYEINEYPGKQKKILLSPFIFYTILTFLIYVLPYTKVMVPYIISGSVMLAFLPVVMSKKRKWMNYVTLLLFFSIIIFLLDFLFGGYSFIDSINEAIRNVRFFTPVLWTVYAYDYCHRKRYGHFMISFFSVVGVILFKTLNVLSQDQWAARILAKAKTQDTPEIRAYRLQNVGGFEFSYMMGVVTIALVWTALKVKNKFVRIICTGATILSFYYIIQTMYTTLLLLTALGVLALLLFNIKDPLIKLLIIVIFIVLSFSLAPLFEYLSGVFKDSLLSTKFMQIHDALSGGGIETLGSRPQHILDALENWLHSPIIGGYNVGNKNHSTIIGLLERNGLVGLSFYLIMFYKSWKILSEDMKKKGYNSFLFNIVCIYLLVLSFFNPIGYVFELTIATFFVVPLWIAVVYKKYENNLSL